MILASQSPRRIELMREAGYDIRVIPADIDETPFDDETPLTLVERLARTKAAAIAAEHADPMSYYRGRHHRHLRWQAFGQAGKRGRSPHHAP